MGYGDWRKDIDKQKWINDKTGKETYVKPSYCGGCGNSTESCTCGHDTSDNYPDREYEGNRLPKHS